MMVCVGQLCVLNGSVNIKVAIIFIVFTQIAFYKFDDLYVVLHHALLQVEQEHISVIHEFPKESPLLK